MNDKKRAKNIHDDIRNILEKNNAILSNTNSQYRKGQEVDGKFVMLSPDIVQELLKKSYDALEAKDDGICNTFSMIEPTFLFSISGMNNTGFSEVAVIVRENRKLGKYKKNGTMYQDGPDDGNNEGALAKKLRKTMPVLVLTEQISKEWKYPFWWPVYYTPETMNVGIYAEKKAKDGIIEDIRSADQKAIFIEKFELIDMAGVDSDIYEKLLGGIEEVENYYNKAFYIKHNPGKRTGVICPIKIEDYDTASKEEVVKKKLDRIKKQVIAQLNQAGVDENSHPRTDLLLSRLSDLDITDELVESAQDEIEALEIPKPQKISLILFIHEATTIISGRKEIGGLFIPLGSGRCEIRLYLETIREWSGNDEELTRKLCKYVLAHEMYHAYHYAEVMTESGRWIYTRKDSLKQSALQETLDELDRICQRSEHGTDLFIPGFMYSTADKEWVKTILLEIVDNFLYSIYTNKLEVVVEDTRLNKESLPAVLTLLGPRAKNASMFYDVIREDNQQVHEMIEPFHKLGSLRLRLLYDHDLSKKVLVVRKSGMRIARIPSLPRGISYVGFLELQGERLNEFFRNMENPKHNAWEPKRHEKSELAKQYKEEVEDWVRTKISEKLIEISGEESVIDIGDCFNYQDRLPEENKDERKKERIVDTVKSIEVIADTPTEQRKFKITDIGGNTGTSRNADRSGTIDDVGGRKGHRTRTGTKKGGAPTGRSGREDFAGKDRIYDGKHEVYVSARIISRGNGDNLLIYKTEEDIEFGEMEIVTKGENGKIMQLYVIECNGDRTRAEEGHIVITGVKAGIKNTAEFKIAGKRSFAMGVKAYGN